MSTETLEIVVKDSGTQEVNRNIDGIGKAAEGAQGQVDRLGGAISTLKGLIASAGIGLGIQQLLQYGEAYQKIIGQIRGVVSSTQQLYDVEAKLFAVAQQTRQSFEGTVSLYSNLAKSAQGLGIDQTELLKVTGLVNKVLTASGSSAEESSGALRRLSLSLAQGTFNARAATTIMLQFPALGRAVAQGLNVSIGQLQAMAEQGQLTARDFFRGIENAEKQIEARFKNMPVTISQAFTLLQNEFLRYIGQLNQATGVTSTLSSAVQFLAANFETLIKTLTVSIAIYGAYRIALAITAVATAALTASQSAFVASLIWGIATLGIFGTALAVVRGLFASLAATFLANPFVFIIVALTAVIALIYAFGNSVKLNADGSITALGALMGVFNLLAAGVNVVTGYMKEFVVWVQNTPAAVNFLQGSLIALGLVMTALAANQIIGFLASLVAMAGRAAIAFGTLLLTPVGLAIAAFVAGAVAVAYFTGTLDTLVAKMESVGSQVVTSITAKMKEATATLNATGAAGAKSGNDIKAGADLGAAGINEQTKALDINKKGWGDYTEKVHYYTEVITNAQGKMQTVVRQTGQSFQEMERDAVQAEADIENRYRGMAEAVGGPVQQGAAIANQALQSVSDTAQSTATSVSSSMSQAIQAASAARAAISKDAAPGTGYSNSPGGTGSYTSWKLETRENIADAIFRANQISAQDGGGQSGPIIVDQLDTVQRNKFDSNNMAEALQALSGLSGNAKAYLKSRLTPFALPVGFRNGGAFEVAGSGGPDSQLVQLMASPGETVTIETPEQRRRNNGNGSGSRGAGNLNVTINIATPDVNGFNRSRKQVKQQVLSDLLEIQGSLL